MENPTSPSKKRLLLILVIAIITIGGGVWFFMNYLNRSRAGGANASINLTSAVTANNGTEFDMPITLNSDGAEVVATDINLVFDRSYLDVVSITPQGPFTSVFSLLPQVDGVWNPAPVIASANQTGTIIVGGIVEPENPNPTPYQGNDIVIVVKFRTKQAGSTAITVNFVSGTTSDSNIVTSSGADSLSQVTNSTVTIASETVEATVTPTPPLVEATATPTPTAIIEATATPTPTTVIEATATPTPTASLDATSTPPPAFTPTPTPGQIVTTQDIRRGYGSREQSSPLDLNGDGKVNVMDLLLLR